MEVTSQASSWNRRLFFPLSKYHWGHKVWMQMQEENGPTNLIYFHTDLTLALAPDWVWVSPVSTCLHSLPWLSALWQGTLSLCTLPAECQEPYLVAEKVVPRRTTVFHGRIRNSDAPQCPPFGGSKVRKHPASMAYWKSLLRSGERLTWDGTPLYLGDARFSDPEGLVKLMKGILWCRSDPPRKRTGTN